MHSGDMGRTKMLQMWPRSGNRMIMQRKTKMSKLLQKMKHSNKTSAHYFIHIWYSFKKVQYSISVNLYVYSFVTDNPPSLAWSHVNSDSFLDDINHVTHYHGNHTYDCLELTRDDRYIMSIQLTYRYTATTPSEAVRSYFTLTKFGGGNVVVVAKSDFTIPDPRKRNNITVKQPITMVRSDQLISGDRLCVTVAHPELIYASQIDNFFGVFSLWRIHDEIDNCVRNY